MKALFNFFLIAFALLGAQAQAVTYAVTSTSNYTSVTDYTSPCTTGPCTNYTTSESISGSFDVPTALAPNLSNADIHAAVTAYSFTDGINTYASTDPSVRTSVFRLSTDGSGNITVATTLILVERWLTGTSPHAVNDRIAIVSIGGALAFTRHNLFCTGVGPSGTGMPDSCYQASQDTSTSSASGAALTMAAQAAPAVVNVPTLSEWGMLILSTLLAVGTLLAMSRRKV
jgi:hypothetical protein